MKETEHISINLYTKPENTEEALKNARDMVDKIKPILEGQNVGVRKLKANKEVKP